MVIGCIACITDPGHAMAEVACVAVHPEFRNRGFGDQMLAAVEQEARKTGIDRLYILTTRTSHWFLERGFSEDTLEVLPEPKRQQYNRERGSRVMIKAL